MAIDDKPIITVMVANPGSNVEFMIYTRLIKTEHGIATEQIYFNLDADGRPVIVTHPRFGSAFTMRHIPDPF